MSDHAQRLQPYEKTAFPETEIIAHKIIDDEESYYVEIPELKGIWAAGKTLEECRKRSSEVIDGWIILGLRRGLPIPLLGKYRVSEPMELTVSA